MNINVFMGHVYTLVGRGLVAFVDPNETLVLTDRGHALVKQLILVYPMLLAKVMVASHRGQSETMVGVLALVDVMHGTYGDPQVIFDKYLAEEGSSPP